MTTGLTETPAHVESTITTTINDNSIAEHNVLYARARIHILATDRRRVLMDQIQKRIAAVTSDLTMEASAKRRIIDQLHSLLATVDPGLLGYNRVNDTVRNTLSPNAQYGVAAASGAAALGVATLGLISWNKSDKWYKKVGAVLLGALSLPLAYVGFSAWQAPEARARQNTAVRMQDDIDLWNRLRTAGPVNVFANPELATGRNMLLAAPETVFEIGGKFVRIQRDGDEVVLLVANDATMAGARRWRLDLSFAAPAVASSPEGVTFNSLRTSGLLENPTGPDPYLRLSSLLARGGAGMQREQGELLLGGQASATSTPLRMYLSQADLERVVQGIAALAPAATNGSVNGITVQMGPPATPPATRPAMAGRTIRFTEVTRPAPGTPERTAYDAINSPAANTAFGALVATANSALATAASPADLPAVQVKIAELNALVPVGMRGNAAIASAANARIEAVLRGRTDGAIFIVQGNAQFRLTFAAPDGFKFEAITLPPGDDLTALNFINNAAQDVHFNAIKNTADAALGGPTPQATAAIGNALTALNAGVMPASVRANASVQAAALHRIATIVGTRPAGGNLFTIASLAPPNNRFRLSFSSTDGFKFVLVS